MTQDFQRVSATTKIKLDNRHCKTQLKAEEFFFQTNYLKKNILGFIQHNLLEVLTHYNFHILIVLQCTLYISVSWLAWESIRMAASEHADISIQLPPQISNYPLLPNLQHIENMEPSRVLAETWSMVEGHRPKTFLKIPVWPQKHVSIHWADIEQLWGQVAIPAEFSASIRNKLIKTSSDILQLITRGNHNFIELHLQKRYLQWCNAEISTVQILGSTLLSNKSH